MKKNKKLLFYAINILIVLMISLFTIYKIIHEKGIETFVHVKNISLVSLIVLIFLFIVNYFLEGVIIAISVSEYKKEFNSMNGIVVHSIGALFSAITPMKSGYLPGVAYSYSKFGVSSEIVIKSMAKTSYTYQIWCLIMGIIVFSVCYNKEMVVSIGEINLNVKYIALLGLLYNCILIIGYFILILCPYIHNIIIKMIAFILYRIKKITSFEIYVNEKKQKMQIIRNEIKEYFKNVKSFLKLLILYVIKGLCYGVWPYIIYLLITKDSFEISLLFYTLIMGNLVSYISSIVPIPGASGATEVTFIAVFSILFSEYSILNSIMLIWRMFSYFLNIIVGFIVFLITINVNKKSKI